MGTLGCKESEKNKVEVSSYLRKVGGRLIIEYGTEAEEGNGGL